MEELTAKHCKPCEGGIPPLDNDAAKNQLTRLNKSWQLNDTSTVLYRTYDFKNYYQTMAFVNAIAWISHNENHHPDLEVSYHSCRVSYTTHAINGLSENDFICAAKIDNYIEKVTA